MVLILIAAHLTAVFNFTVPFLSYYANYTYFATEACVNKDHPELDCDGTCQLHKMVQQQHQSKDQAASTTIERAPKTDFFFQKRFAFSHIAPRLTHLFATSDDQMQPLWQNEPLAPPPRLT